MYQTVKNMCAMYSDSERREMLVVVVVVILKNAVWDLKLSAKKLR